MSIILTDSQGQRYRLTHGWGSDICSNKNLFRGPGQAQAFIGELAREQTTEIYQTFFGGTDHLPRHLCTPQVNVGVINGPSIFTQVRSNNDRIADAIERSQLIIEKDNSLQPVADDRAILRVKIKQALNEILIAERAETAKIDEEFQKLSYFRKDLALRWASLKGLGGAAWDLAKWIKEVNDLTSMQLRLYRYAKNAATASGTENFYDTFTSLNLDAELRELIDVLGFDPTKVSLDDIKKALDLADQVTSDGPLMRDIGMFIKDFALSQHRLEVAEFGGAAAFEIILTAILTALTGGVGLGVAIASKARLIRQFEKLGKLLSEFAIANKKVGKYLADKAKRAGKSVKRSFDDVKTEAPAQTKTDKPSSNKPKPTTKTIKESFGTNEAVWTVDEKGRPISVEAKLDSTHQSNRSSAETKLQSSVGDDARLSDDDGGHLVGHRFMSDQGDKNLFPQNSNLNRGAYKKMENEWADWTAEGYEVKLKVKLDPPGSDRPSNIIAEYEVVDPKSGDVIFDRRHNFSNNAGEAFDRVKKSDMKGFGG